MSTIYQWLDEYTESHQNPTNKLIHWICVPAIAVTVLGFANLVNLVSLPIANITLMHVIGALALAYYAYLSPKLAFGMAPVIYIGFVAADTLMGIGIPPWVVFAVIFVIAWIGQFIGHHIEGKKPSFFKDVQFLLIGPLWLLSFIYKKLGINY